MSFLNIKLLSSLDIGQKAVIKSPIKITNIIFRLLEMGMTKGTNIEVVRRDITGGILQINIRESRLCMRIEEASLFLVQIL